MILCMHAKWTKLPKNCPTYYQTNYITLHQIVHQIKKLKHPKICRKYNTALLPYNNSEDAAPKDPPSCRIIGMQKNKYYKSISSINSQI